MVIFHSYVSLPEGKSWESCGKLVNHGKPMFGTLQSNVDEKPRNWDEGEQCRDSLQA